MTLIKIYYENSDEMVPLSNLEYSPDFLRILADMGVITLKHDNISCSELKKVNRLLRLRNWLGVNVSGAAIILDLLDRIDALEAEIQSLKRR